MTQEVLLGGIGLGAVTGLVQVGKSVGLSSRFAPLVSILLGVLLLVAHFFSYQTDKALFEAVLQGIVLGLASSGLYSSTQTFVNGPTVLRQDEAEQHDYLVLPKGAIQQQMNQPNSPAVEGEQLPTS